MSQEKQKSIYDKFYLKHGKKIHNHPARFTTTAMLCKGDVLDVGCGTGDLAAYYKGVYCGIDISSVAIQYAIELGRKDAAFFIDDALNPNPEARGKFDTIVLAEFLEHIKDDSQVFENIKTWAKPNARLIISVPNGDSVPDENHEREFTMPELRKKLKHLGLVKFWKWPGVHQRLICTVDLGQKRENEVSMPMIVWNEAQGLEDAVISAMELIDEIIISVDYKSNDGTLKIAKKYADVLLRHRWHNDFSRARNEVQKYVTKPWSLMLDGHEFVKKYPDFEKMLKTKQEGLLVKIIMDNKRFFYYPRLYRSHCLYKYKVHNLIKTKSNKAYKKFIIIHDRENKQSMDARDSRTRQRNKMMPEVLRAKIKKNKKDSRSLYYLARHLHDKNKFKEATKLYKKCIKYSTWKSKKWEVCYLLSVMFNARGKYLKALNWLRKADKIMPNRWEIAKRRGVVYMGFEQWEKAVKWLVDSFKINTGDFTVNPEPRNNTETWDYIGICFFNLRNYKQALIAWRKSLHGQTETELIKLLQGRIKALVEIIKER